MKNITLIISALFLSVFLNAQEKANYSVAFYNLENLFDTLDSDMPGDFAWTPGGGKIWNSKRYGRKLDNLAYVIDKLDGNNKQHGPAVIGVCEVENRSVLEDLIQTKPINQAGYDIVHYDSPDHRGIDVALLYRKEFFEVISSKTYTLHFPGEDYHTRDQLLVTGKLNGEKVSIIVNHWPSRRGGPEKSEPRRIAAAKLCKHIADSVKKADKNANLIIMGDFNDNPADKSITEVMEATGNKENLDDFTYYNPLANKLNPHRGTLCYRDTWYVFDQILISKPLLDDKGLSFKQSVLYDDEHIRVKKGKYKDHPLRTHAGTLYLWGYSDHFPVYVVFE